MSRDRDRDRDRSPPFSLTPKYKTLDHLTKKVLLATQKLIPVTKISASKPIVNTKVRHFCRFYCHIYLDILFSLTSQLEIILMNTWYFLALDHHLSNLKLTRSAKYLYTRLLSIYPPFVKIHAIKSTLSKDLNLTIRQVERYLSLFEKYQLVTKSYETTNCGTRKVGHSLYLELTPPSNLLQNYISRYGTDEMMESNNQSIGIQITEALHG